jgi:uncharacterized repeat protein (TIGR02543 family)
MLHASQALDHFRGLGQYDLAINYGIGTIPITITYHPNGGTGTISDTAKTKDMDLILSDGSGFTRTGYDFVGWNTLADGTGTSYMPGALYSVNEPQTFFAVWNANPTSVNQMGFDDISIFPNPTTNMVYFKNILDNSHIVLADLSGRSIFEKKASELNEGLSLESYANGIYLLKVIHEHEYVKSIKVLKR